MKLSTLKLNILALSFFVINVLAMPGLTREALAAGAEAGAAAGAAEAGAAGGAATAAGITTGTIAAGAAIAATAALAIATGGGEARVIPGPTCLECGPVNPVPITAMTAALQQLDTTDTANLAAATTALGTGGSTALATAASTLSTAEFANLATLLASLNQSTASGLASAMTVEALGSSQGGIAPTTAFATNLTSADVTAVMSALNTDIGTVPLAARDSLTQVQKDLYDYVAGLRTNAQANPALKNAFNGAYNALDRVKSSSSDTSALVDIINSTSSSKSDLSALNNFLTQASSSSSTFSATQNLFKNADSKDVQAMQNIFSSAVVSGKVDTTALTGITDLLKDLGTGTPEQIAQKQADALMILLTQQHPGYTVTVTAVHHGNNVYTTVAHIKK